jgi:hypothetical protein
MPCSSDSPLPGVQYPQGTSLPDAVFVCAGTDLSLADDLTLIVTDFTPDGPEMFALGGGQLTGSGEQLVVDWTMADLGALPVGPYGVTVIATFTSEAQKWRGTLHIVQAAQP